MTQLEFDFEQLPARPGVLRRVRLGAGELHYRLVRGRRRTIAVYVDAGAVEARAPRRTPLAEVEAFLREKERWIARHLARSKPEPPPLRWVEGETLPVQGRTARLTASSESGEVRLTGDRLLLPSAYRARWRALAIEWLRALALARFRERVRHYAAALGLSEPSLGLSNARTQWGSCWKSSGENGRVLLHWRLIQLPPQLCDYVVAHELAHLRELNHSARFWKTVQTVIPEYRAARRELDRLGRALVPL